MSVDFAAYVQRTFSWLSKDGYALVKTSPNEVSFSRPPLTIDVSWEGHTKEVFVTVRCGEASVDLTSLRIFRGDLPSYAGKPDPGGLPWAPTVRTEHDAAHVLLELSELLKSFRSTALNPDGIYLLQASKMEEREAEIWLAEPSWITATTIARVFEAGGDWAGVIKELEEFEPELDDRTRALLEKARSEVRRSVPEG